MIEEGERRIKEEILNHLKEYLCQENTIIFSYVFGSFVKKHRKKYNDVDIAIYLSQAPMGTFEYLNLKRELMEITKTEVDLVILNQAPPLIKNQIFSEGICLFSKDDVLKGKFIVKSLFEYNDMKKYYALSYEKMIQHKRKEVSIDGEN